MHGEVASEEERMLRVLVRWRFFAVFSLSCCTVALDKLFEAYLNWNPLWLRSDFRAPRGTLFETFLLLYLSLRIQNLRENVFSYLRIREKNSKTKIFLATNPVLTRGQTIAFQLTTALSSFTYWGICEVALLAKKSRSASVEKQWLLKFGESIPKTD